MSEKPMENEGITPRYFFHFKIIFSEFVIKDCYITWVTPQGNSVSDYEFSFDDVPPSKTNVSEAMIDAITASMTKEQFQTKFGEATKSSVGNTIRITDHYSSKCNIALIWDNKAFSEYALALANNPKTNYRHIPLARVPVGANRFNGGLFLSRLIALIKDNQESASNLAGKDFINIVLSHDRAVSSKKMTAENPMEIPEDTLKPGNEVEIDYQIIHKLVNMLESKKLKIQETNPDIGKKYCLVRNENHQNYIWNFEQERFVCSSDENFEESCVPIHTIDRFTTEFNSPFALDTQIINPDASPSVEYFIGSWDVERGTIRYEYDPIFKRQLFHIKGSAIDPVEGIGRMLDDVDQYGFYAGSDDFHVVLEIIREYGRNIENVNQINSQAFPFIATYPYVDYASIRMMMQKIIKKNEADELYREQRLNKTPNSTGDNKE